MPATIRPSSASVTEYTTAALCPLFFPEQIFPRECVSIGHALPPTNRTEIPGRCGDVSSAGERNAPSQDRIALRVCSAGTAWARCTRSPRSLSLSLPLSFSFVLHCSWAQPLTIIHQHEILETMAQRSDEPTLAHAARPSARDPPEKGGPGGARFRVCSRKPSSNYFRRLYSFASDL